MKRGSSVSGSTDWRSSIHTILWCPMTHQTYRPCSHPTAPITGPSELQQASIGSARGRLFERIWIFDRLQGVSCFRVIGVRELVMWSGWCLYSRPIDRG